MCAVRRNNNILDVFEESLKIYTVVLGDEDISLHILLGTVAQSLVDSLQDPEYDVPSLWNSFENFALLGTHN